MHARTHTHSGLVTASCQALAIPWTVAFQDHLSMGFSRQEYWSGLSFPSPGNLPDPGIEPGSPTLQEDSLLTELQEKPYIYTHTLCVFEQLLYSQSSKACLGV